MRDVQSEREVFLVAYQSSWESVAKQHMNQLRHVFGDLPIEHVGSTSIPGMVAKPIVDLVVGVGVFGDLWNRRNELEMMGYVFKEHGVKDDVLIVDSDTQRLVHIHVVIFNGLLWRRYIGFKALLINNQSLANEYATLKQSLAQKYPYNRALYTKKKAPFILSCLIMLGLE